MKIVIKKKRGFAACQTAVSNDETRRYLSGVLIQPDGTVVGTNGHYMVICKDCVEPFNGDSVVVVAKQLSAAQYNSNFDAELFLDGKEGHITFWVGKSDTRDNNSRQLVVADMIDVKFPEWEQFDVELDDKRKGCKRVGFNAEYIAKVAKIACASGSTIDIRLNGELDPAQVFFGETGEDKRLNVKMILMPVRLGDA